MFKFNKLKNKCMHINPFHKFVVVVECEEICDEI